VREVTADPDEGGGFFRTGYALIPRRLGIYHIAVYPHLEKGAWLLPPLGTKKGELCS
jgi:hypothetical protein